ncbi:hypothetical protein DZC72_06805 [Maribacter algicola]|uniref:Adhesin domain-containing protein n=1 Tax=Maribacter algicola TaxID=2498892 RepID=A0A3R8RQ78_9FLAO|nr:hypothetical protein [Maribacter algicola]RRQ50267.1 hypothetical protein DZC72_06805 [Maribacter algicola]
MKLFPLVLLLIAAQVTAQKKVHKVLLGESVKLIQVNAENCYEVILETGDNEEIEVDAQMDGEYSDDLQMKVSEVGNTLVLGAGFQPVFKNPNDKLSAHKVVSIALKIKLPKYKSVQVFGNSSRVIAFGDYLKLDVTLSDGTCELHNISQAVNVRTQSGNIVVYANRATISAETKYGQYKKDTIPNGFNSYKLNSVTGNIILNKTE